MAWTDARDRMLQGSAAFAFLALAFSAAAAADEPRGCDKFKWPVAHAQAALAAPDVPHVAAGGTRAVGPGAFTLTLAPGAEAKLPMPPERSSKQTPSFAGFAHFAAPAQGLYQVTLSSGVWVDLIQDGIYLKPAGFSGAIDCPGVRKLIRYEVGASPFVLQVSGAPAETVGVVVEKVPDGGN